jgi:hypothetical protein
MKMMIRSLSLLTVASALFLSHAGADRPARAAVEHSIAVRAVSGAAEYAYDSTGWKALRPGKVLHAGATVRTSNDGNVLLAMEEEGSFIRVGPMSKLELAKAAPGFETISIVPVQASFLKSSAARRSLARK